MLLRARHFYLPIDASGGRIERTRRADARTDGSADEIGCRRQMRGQRLPSIAAPVQVRWSIATA
ncbi:MAG TPA: hypothetical protein PKM09_01345 [Bacillota bacterium]|nr:hypothetical protein [Bacillota bacterium]HNY67345.1 hypothetical protein [Bacillota bacterium]HPU74877.1 hypothetical protein [Bacillota bacterium]